MNAFWKLVDRFLGGHFSIGRLTVYGHNAMHWAVNYRTERWGWMCLRLPLPSQGGFRPLYFYASPNATPWASTIYKGWGDDVARREAPERRKKYGHNFDTDLLWTDRQLVEIYGPEEGMKIAEEIRTKRPGENDHEQIHHHN